MSPPVPVRSACRAPHAALLLALASAWSLVAPSPVGATVLVRLTAGEVDQRAAWIVEGRCVGAKAVTIPGLAMPVTEYVLEVERVVKAPQGAPEPSPLQGTRFTFRQIGGADADSRLRGIVGLPTYAPGSRYRLALHGVSARGLTSPVGFGQGVRVLADDAATKPAAPR